MLFCEVLPEVEQHGEDGPQFIVPDLLDLAVALGRQDLLYFPACFSGYGIGHSFVFRTISKCKDSYILVFIFLLVSYSRKP